MPRDRSAALAAWMKRKRAQVADLNPGNSTAAAVAAMGVGGTTRAALLDAHGRVKAMKEKLAAQRVSAPSAQMRGKDSKSMPLASNAVRNNTAQQAAWDKKNGAGPLTQQLPAAAQARLASARAAAKPAGPKPVAGPMAGKGTLTRAAIGQKAAAKRRENKAKQGEAAKAIGRELLAAEGRMKGNAAASENAHPAKADPIDRSKVGGPSGKAGDLFGHNRDADATPGSDAFNRACHRT